MKQRKWSIVLAPVLFVTVALTGCGAAVAQGTNNMSSGSGPSTGSANSMTSGNSMNSTNSMSSGSSMGTNNTMAATASGAANPLASGDVLVGAAASPPMGNGNGNLLFESVQMPKTVQVPLTAGANAFAIGMAGNVAYVPTLQGKTYVVDLNSHQVTSAFSTPPGARIANVSQAHHLLVVTGAKNVTAYSLPALKQVWQLETGGNTLSIAGNMAYLASNSAPVTRVIDLQSGKIVSTIPVGMIEDSVYDKQQHTLWLANWNNGDMTIVNTLNNKVVKTIQEAEGGGFSMQDMGNMNSMMNAKGGFMQLAVGPRGNHVYAASFSGNIMVYNAMQNMFEKDIPTVPGAKLSGIAIDPSGKYAYTTVESKMETVAVSLQTDQVVSTYPKLESNRWRVLH